MHKLLFATSAAILALSIASCDSLPFLGGGGEEEATPETSPSPTAETPASPTPTPTPFASPDVPQKAPGAPALIQSSNPDERVSRLEQEVGGSGQNQTSTPPTTLGLPPGRDPFSSNIPIPPSSSQANGENGTAGGDAGPVVVTQLPSQRVPQIPTLPEIVSPPQLGGPRSPTLPGDRGTIGQGGQRTGPAAQGGQGTGPAPQGGQRTGPAAQGGQRTGPSAQGSQRTGPTAQGSQRTGPTADRKDGQIPNLASSQVPQLPQVPELTSPPKLGGGRQAPQGGQRTGPTADRKDGQIPNLASSQVPQLPQVPELNSPPKLGGGRQGGNIPSTLDSGGPRQLAELPQLPVLQAPNFPSGIGLGPAEPIPEIPTIAIQPKGVPNLPELPVQDPPPEWRDPNARPEPIAGGGEPPPPPPPPPSTDLAKGVKVTGVVEVGNEKQVIIEAPNEATSRYVKVGQRVAGGKVLVKRVDFENGEAIVILEQNDIEVRKVVGEEPAVE